MVVPELNTGQLRMLLRSEFLVDCIGVNKIKGKPFTVGELTEEIEKHASRLRSKEQGRHKLGVFS